MCAAEHVSFILIITFLDSCYNLLVKYHILFLAQLADLFI